MLTWVLSITVVLIHLVLTETDFDCQDLGMNTIQLIATDVNGNTKFWNVTVNLTLGNNAGFTLTTTGVAEPTSVLTTVRLRHLFLAV